MMAAEIAGNEFPNKDNLPGLINYLRVAATAEMPAFLSLLSKILPVQVVDKNGKDVEFTHIERVIIHAYGNEYGGITEGEAPVEVIDAEHIPAFVKAS